MFQAKGRREVMSEEKSRLVSEFEKNNAEMVRIHLIEWKAQTYVDIRVWYRGDDGALHPGTKGIRLNAELLPELRSALDAAISALENGAGVEIVQDGAKGAGC
jgi:hypothetical protein